VSASQPRQRVRSFDHPRQNVERLDAAGRNE
jgi:hypothetical protein